jgi:hypothetical protein
MQPPPRDPGAGPLARGLLAVLLLLLAAGCASTPERLSPREAVSRELDGAPDWVVKGCSAWWGDDDDAHLCGVGSMGGTRNVSLAITTAMARGRTEIARTLQTKVKAMLEDYQATTTGGEEYGSAAADEQHVVDVSRQITDLSLSGSERKDLWISPNGTIFALMVLDLEKFQDSVARMDQLSERVRKAVIDRAEASFKELDEQVDKERAEH